MNCLLSFMTFWIVLSKQGLYFSLFFFNSASRWPHVLWASHYPFIHSIKDSVLPSEGLPVQLHQLVTGTGSLTNLTWIVPIFHLCESARSKPKAGFLSNVQVWPYQGLVVPPWQRGHALIVA